MNKQTQKAIEFRPAGYEALISRYQLEVIPNWHCSFVAATNTHRIDTTAGITKEIYPSRHWPGQSVGDHLEFALKYDGINLAILAGIFEVMPSEEILSYIQSKPTGQYARRLWFLYEFLTGSLLPIDGHDLKRIRYIDLLNPAQYYTVTQARPIHRQRINDNLLGDNRFCPTRNGHDTLQFFVSHLHAILRRFSLKKSSH